MEVEAGTEVVICQARCSVLPTERNICSIIHALRRSYILKNSGPLCCCFRVCLYLLLFLCFCVCIYIFNLFMTPTSLNPRISIGGRGAGFEEMVGGRRGAGHLPGGGSGGGELIIRCPEGTVRGGKGGIGKLCVRACLRTCVLFLFVFCCLFVFARACVRERERVCMCMYVCVVRACVRMCVCCECVCVGGGGGS